MIYPTFLAWILPLVLIALAIFALVKILDYLKLRATISGDGREPEKVRLEDIEARLDEIERRLTDVQDVMISLSEKFDRWEGKRIEV